MERNRVYRVIITVMIVTTLLWVAGFHFIYIYASHSIREMYDRETEYVLANLELFGTCPYISGINLLMLVEYDEHNMRDSDILYNPQGINIDKIYGYSNVFMRPDPRDSSKQLMFIYRDISMNIYFIIFFTSIVGSVIFIAVMLFFIHMRYSRLRKLKRLRNEIISMDMDAIEKADYMEEDIHDIITLIVEMSDKSKRKMDSLRARIERLENDNEALRDKDVLKTGVLENISHELRSPLTKVKGYLDFIYDEKMGKLSESQKSGLLVAKNNVDSLLDQIEQIMRYAKDEVFNLTAEMFSLKTLLKEVLAVYEEDMNEKGLILEFNAEHLINPIKADRGGIYEVFDNLISNALKFTRKGDKIAIIGYEKKISDGLYAFVKIEDTGVGIPSDKLNRIFERFYQVEQDINRKYEGMGLGLTIANAIVNAHSGRILVSSILQKGTTFTVMLPLKTSGGAYGQ